MTLSPPLSPKLKLTNTLEAYVAFFRLLHVADQYYPPGFIDSLTTSVLTLEPEVIGLDESAGGPSTRPKTFSEVWMKKLKSPWARQTRTDRSILEVNCRHSPAIVDIPLRIDTPLGLK